MHPSTPSNPSPSDLRPAKTRILLPIVLSVAALVVFLVLFWNDGRHGKRRHGGSHTGTSGAAAGHRSEGRSPVGGSARDADDEGSSEVTQGSGGSPVGGGEGRAQGKNRDSGKDGGWWYEDGSKSAGTEDGWWYQSKKGKPSEPGSPVGRAGSERSSPVGGAAE